MILLTELKCLYIFHFLSIKHKRWVLDIVQPHLIFSYLTIFDNQSNFEKFTRAGGEGDNVERRTFRQWSFRQLTFRQWTDRQ